MLTFFNKTIHLLALQVLHAYKVYISLCDLIFRI